MFLGYNYTDVKMAPLSGIDPAEFSDAQQQTYDNLQAEIATLDAENSTSYQTWFMQRVLV